MLFPHIFFSKDKCYYITDNGHNMLANKIWYVWYVQYSGHETRMWVRAWVWAWVRVHPWLRATNFRLVWKILAGLHKPDPGVRGLHNPCWFLVTPALVHSLQGLFPVLLTHFSIKYNLPQCLPPCLLCTCFTFTFHLLSFLDTPQLWSVPIPYL